MNITIRQVKPEDLDAAYAVERACFPEAEAASRDSMEKRIAEQLMRHLIDVSRKAGRKGMGLTCKEHLIHYYAKFGYENQGVSGSTHGGALWYDMFMTL